MIKLPVKIRDIGQYYPLFFTILFIFILIQYSFSTLEGILYDIRIKYDFGSSFKNNIVLVMVDEESDDFLGEKFPYTYASHLRFVEKLFQDGPALVSYLIRPPAPENQRDQNYLKQFDLAINEFSKNGDFRFGIEEGQLASPMIPKKLLKYGQSLSKLESDDVVFAKDNVLRRIILNSSGEDSLHLWIANTYREKIGENKIEAKDFFGSFYNRETDSTYTRLKYLDDPREERSRIETIPFHRVVVGNFPPGFFSKKIVLVGSRYVSKGSDFILTPYNKDSYNSSKINLHALIIQSLINEDTIFEVPQIITHVLSIFIALFLSIIISRVQPTRGLFITVSMLAFIMLISYLLFSIFGIWIYLSHLVLSIFAVYYIWVPFKAIDEYKRRFAIQEETKLLKQVDHLKQNFISLMSHDLKTPVAKIAGISDVLLTKFKNSPDQERNLFSIVQATKELNKFITSILDLTKVESRNIKLNTVSKDINQVIEQVVEGLRFEAGQSKMEIILELAPLYPIKLDIELIKRVLSNLIENAIKYSGPETKVHIKTHDDEKWVYVEISDTGVGMTMENLEHIFDKFYRVKNDSVHRIKGSGLGLYLVKYFVELQGGLISVKSEVGNGTTFIIQLKNM